MKLLALIILLLAAPAVLLAQTAVFTDNFSSSTLNGTSTPGGTPAASSTSYDIAASKADTTFPTISSGNLKLGLNSATGSGFYEAQAVFSSSANTLVTVNDYINLTYTFTDVANLLTGNTASGVYAGLYDDAGATPVAGALNNSGLNTTAGSTFDINNAELWSGYVGRLQPSGGTLSIYNRAVQNGSGTTSANQDLIGNNFGGGAFNNPTGSSGTQTGGTAGSTLALTTGNQYTMSLTIALTAAGTLSIGEALYSGVGTGGALLGSLTNSFSGVTDTTFDGLAIGVRNSSTTSANPQMTINDIVVTDDIQPIPEPSALALAGLGMLGVWAARRLRR